MRTLTIVLYDYLLSSLSIVNNKAPNNCLWLLPQMNYDYKICFSEQLYKVNLAIDCFINLKLLLNSNLYFSRNIISFQNIPKCRNRKPLSRTKYSDRISFTLQHASPFELSSDVWSFSTNSIYRKRGSI